MNRERLTACLKPERQQAGLYLEDDEDFVYLKRGDKMLAVWLSTNVTVETILHEADRGI